MPLSRQQMEETIRRGGSVLVSVGGKKRLVSSVDKLPSAAELANTDEEKQAAAADLDKQIADLQAKRSGLNTPAASSEPANNESTGEEETLESLTKLSRADLEKRGQAAGVENPESYPNKEELAKAILEK